MEFFAEIELNQAEAEVIARGLFAVARAEGGVHAAELAMVRSFLGEVVGGQGREMAGLETGSDVAPAMIAAALAGEPKRLLFLKSCILLGYADGRYGDKERALVDGYAKALGIGKERLTGLEQSVKEYLLGQIAGTTSTESAVKAARSLGT